MGRREKKAGRKVAYSGLGDWEPYGFACGSRGREGGEMVSKGRAFQVARMARAKALRLTRTQKSPRKGAGTEWCSTVVIPCFPAAVTVYYKILLSA